MKEKLQTNQIKDNLTERKRDWDDDSIKLLTDLVDMVYNVDFSNYAIASLSRRITHVIKIFGFENLDILLNKIQNEKDFKSKFLNEITVGATEMFRDPNFWLALKSDIFPELLEKKGNLNFWVLGCSTGEEIFTLAIILKELGLFESSTILASDLDPAVIEIAKRGFYYNYGYQKNLDNYKAQGGQAKFDDYIVKTKLGFQMDINLLQNVKFHNYDLVKEEIEEEFDVIFCRNVMIYFNHELQNQVLKKIKHNLNPKGFLALGAKESIMWTNSSSEFKPVHDREKIYKVIEGTIS
jgi:chemotaxis protein methyltransferase CheR